MLHTAGEGVQDICFTFEESAPAEGQTVYSVPKTLLDYHFRTKVNVAYERSIFRSLKQDENESMENYIVRLRQRGVLCEFTDLDEMIRDQIEEKCYSQRLRKKLLEQQDLNLNKVRETAQAMELSQIQAESLEHLVIKQEVNTVCAKPKSNNNKVDDGHQKKNCIACDLFGHFKSDPQMPCSWKEMQEMFESRTF